MGEAGLAEDVGVDRVAGRTWEGNCVAVARWNWQGWERAVAHGEVHMAGRDAGTGGAAETPDRGLPKPRGGAARGNPAAAECAGRRLRRWW